jgi:hypothetical protein
MIERLAWKAYWEYQQKELRWSRQVGRPWSTLFRETVMVLLSYSSHLGLKGRHFTLALVDP